MILATGATGQHGGTGAHVVHALLAAGHAVRILARRRSDKTTELERAGAEVVIGDLHDRVSLIGALSGVSQATFTYPVASGIIEAAANFAAAARQQQVMPHVVVTSMAVAHPESPSHLGRSQWLAEEMLAWAGLDLCVLRIAALFFENLPLLHRRSILEEGEIRSSFGHAEVPWISGKDAGRLVVTALTRPGILGPGVHYPVGAQLLDYAEIARQIGEQLGRPIRFVPTSAQDWAAELGASPGRPAGSINAAIAQHIAAVGAALASGKGPVRQPDAQALARLICGEPMEFRDFLFQEQVFA